MEKVVIVGGGIAGLSCLNALLDYGISPLLIEGSSIGTPKMCGEFLAPQTALLLKQWNIGPLEPIYQANFFTNEKKLKINFSKPAAAFSRSDAELQLAQRAKQYHGRIKENSHIEKIIPATKFSPFIFHLSSGETIETHTAIFATGKFTQESAHTLPYMGIKIHFDHIVEPNTLQMYSVKNAYLGIVPISATSSNCACLAKTNEVEKIGSGRDYFINLIEKHKELNQIFKQINLSKSIWLEGQAPEFRLKSIPNWPQAFWIGDALASLHPAIGSGFAHGISSAIMAAEYYLQGNTQTYLKTSHKTVRPRFIIGKMMHNIMLNPGLSSILFPFLQYNPSTLNFFLKKLKYI